MSNSCSEEWQYWFKTSRSEQRKTRSALKFDFVVFPSYFPQLPACSWPGVWQDPAVQVEPWQRACRRRLELLRRNRHLVSLLHTCSRSEVHHSVSCGSSLWLLLRTRSFLSFTILNNNNNKKLDKRDGDYVCFLWRGDADGINRYLNFGSVDVLSHTGLCHYSL